VTGWHRIAALAPELPQTRDLGRNLLAWILGCAMVYAALFGVGKLCFGQIGTGSLLLGLATVCALLLYRDITQRVGVTIKGSFSG
jgi:TM2 domain-containing membrane protein YozV